MKTNKSIPDTAEKAIDKPEANKATANEQVPDKPNKKGKKKHSSALVAASKGESAVSHGDAHAYKDGNFANTGSNLSYREDQ